MSYRHVKLPEPDENYHPTVDWSSPTTPSWALSKVTDGPDITKAAMRVWDAAVEEAYGGERKIHSAEIFLGEKPPDLRRQLLPGGNPGSDQGTGRCHQGPLTTPVGGGFRSLNVSLRQELDLYACVRPFTYFDGVPRR